MARDGLATTSKIYDWVGYDFDKLKFRDLVDLTDKNGLKIPELPPHQVDFQPAIRNMEEQRNLRIQVIRVPVTQIHLAAGVAVAARESNVGQKE